MVVPAVLPVDHAGLHIKFLLSEVRTASQEQSFFQKGSAGFHATVEFGKEAGLHRDRLASAYLVEELDEGGLGFGGDLDPRGTERD